MQIIWKGQTCFQITSQRPKNGQVVIVIDPFDSASGLRLAPSEGDILAFTGKHSAESLKAVKGELFLIENPGEYEVKEVFIKGIPAATGKNEGEATILIIETEKISLCHLGQLKQKELTEEQIQKIGDVDILLVPVGAGGSLSAEEARKIILQIEPKIVIPMYYRIPGLKIKLESVEGFLKIMGVKGAETLDKLSLKEKDLTSEETRVVLLNP